MTDLALYNVHKRQTLDRVSGKYAFRAREVLRKATQRDLDDFVAAVRRRTEFQPDVEALDRALQALFKDHQRDVIHVAISDGIQEVSPEQDLDAWARFPLAVPVELTLTAELAQKRNTLAEDYLAKNRQTLNKSIADFVTNTVSEYLRNIRKAYTKAAFEWIDQDNDESPDIGDVVSTLKTALRKTDNYAQMVFTTETTNYFNESRHTYFADNTQVDYMQLYAVTDGRVSEICETRHKFVMTIARAKFKQYMPAFHPHCRTIQRPLISALKSHLTIIEAGLKMDEAKFAPLPNGWA